MEFNHRDLMEGSLGSTAFFCFCCICSRDRNTGTMHFCRGGIQINFIIFLFQFVNIYVGSRITITPFSFIIAVLFFSDTFSCLSLLLFFNGHYPCTRGVLGLGFGGKKAREDGDER